MIGGLGESSYYVTIVDNDNFKLSNIGNGNVGIDTGIKDFYYRTNQYVNLLSTGSGTHIFNYPQISVEVNGIIGVSTFAGQDFAAKVQPIFRGEISSVLSNLAEVIMVQKKLLILIANQNFYCRRDLEHK